MRTMMTVVGGIFLHIVQIGLILNIPSKYFFPFELENNVAQRWLNASLILTPLILLFIIFFKEKKLNEFGASAIKIRRWKKVLPFYFMISIALLVALLIREGIKRGSL